MGNNNNLNLTARNACSILQLTGRSNSSEVCRAHTRSPGLAASNCRTGGASTPIDQVVSVTLGDSAPLVGEYHGHSGIEVHGPDGKGFVAFPEVDDRPLRASLPDSGHRRVPAQMRGSPGADMTDRSAHRSRMGHALDGPTSHWQPTQRRGPGFGSPAPTVQRGRRRETGAM